MSTFEANKKIRQLAKEGKHPFQIKRKRLYEIMQTGKYKEKCREAKIGALNPMYGKHGKSNPNWSQVECKCLYCGKEFSVKKSQIAIGEGKYCSFKCYNDSHSLKIKCLNCDKLFKIPLARKSTAKYCSNKCRSEAITGKGAPNWRGGKSFEPYPPEFNNQLKERIRERDNYQCQNCNTKENKRAFPVHHIDYNKNNNEDSNLITLCDFCHKSTSHKREKWQEHFLILPILRKT